MSLLTSDIGEHMLFSSCRNGNSCNSVLDPTQSVIYLNILSDKRVCCMNTSDIYMHVQMFFAFTFYILGFQAILVY